MTERPLGRSGGAPVIARYIRLTPITCDPEVAGLVVEVTANRVIRRALQMKELHSPQRVKARDA